MPPPCYLFKNCSGIVVGRLVVLYFVFFPLYSTRLGSRLQLELLAWLNSSTSLQMVWV